MGAFLEAFLDCLLPPSCGACEVVGRAPFCRLCGEALLPAPPIELPGFERVVAVHRYGGPVALAIRALKFGDRPEIGPALGREMARAMEGFEAPEVLVPIPLPPARLARRGYNQARELARGIPVPARPRALRRLGEPVPQVGLPRSARLQNQHGRFRADPRYVEGRRVVLVDDVLTTGATLIAAREALVAAGARQVIGVVSAYATLEDWG